MTIQKYISPKAPQKRKINWESYVVFFLVFVLCLGTAYVAVFYYGMLVVDAVARVAHAFLVFNNNQAKLAAIGFIWPPLPTLLLLPLAYFKPLAVTAFAANIVSALFAALACVYLNMILRLTSLRKSLRYLFVASFLLNPIIFFYAINGMSEMIFIALLLASSYYLLEWQVSRRITSLALLGVSLGLAFLVRYEAIFFTIALAILIALHLRRQERAPYTTVEGVLFSFVAPSIYFVFLWVYFNYIIMGDPFFFLSSQYAAFSGEISRIESSLILSAQMGSLSQTMAFIFQRLLGIFPAAFLVGLLLALSGFNGKKIFHYGFLVLIFLIPLLLGIFVYRGTTSGKLRYFITAIPFSYASVALLMDRFSTWRKSLQSGLAILLLVAFLISSVAQIVAISTFRYDLVNDEKDFWDALVYNRKLPDFFQEKAGAREVVAFLNSAPDLYRDILLDDYDGWAIILLYGDGKVFIDQADLQFWDALNNPGKYARYILVPDPTVGRAVLNQVNVKYPTLYEQGADFVALVKNFESPPYYWKLYEVRR